MVVLLVEVISERKHKERRFEQEAVADIVKVASLLGLCVEPSVKVWVCVYCKSPLLILTQQGSPTVHTFQFSRTAHIVANRLGVHYLSATIKGDLVGYNVWTSGDCGVRTVSEFFADVLPKFLPSVCPYCHNKQPIFFKPNPDWQPEIFTDIVYDPLAFELACREFGNQHGSVCDLDALLVNPTNPTPVAVIETFITSNPNYFKPFTITARFADLLKIPAFIYGKVKGVGRVCKILNAKHATKTLEVKSLQRLADYLKAEIW